MLRVRCPQCLTFSDFDDSLAGQKVACPCGQKMQLAPPASQNKTVLVPYESESIPYAKPAPEPTWVEPIREKRRSVREPAPEAGAFGKGFAATFGVIAAIVVVFLVLAILSRVASDGASSNNAECFMCGHEFSIPEHKGMDRAIRIYKCPKCSFTNPADGFYKRGR